MSSQLRWSIIRLFSGKNTFVFRYGDVLREFPDKHPIYLARLLSDMVEKGLLGKISRNIYYIIPFNVDPETHSPDGIQIAMYLMQDKEYYIAYASALKVHGITLQSGSCEYVVTKKQTKPSIKKFRGKTYQFIHLGVTRFFGYRSIWINQLEKAMVSDLEKTIVDIATKPQLCGGIIGVGNSIYQAHTRLNRDKLFYYFARNGNSTAKKRYLFLIDLLELDWNAEHVKMLDELVSGISPLDPSMPNQGRNWQKFGLKINVDPIHIKEKIIHH
jgi:predicted transcriptional regulator of viral defense system